ncbi:TPA: hypothetical protein DEP96_01765 [Candidatus Uhrbacteria bacterium]|nr:hypothetical protein [Candidatus Uhrbacteria bacterium]
MSDLKTPKQYLEELIAAIAEWQHRSMTEAKFASQNNLRQQFVFALRDGECQVARCDGEKVFAKQDRRYQKIDYLCRRHGILGFLQAAEDQQRADPRNAPEPVKVNRVYLHSAMKQFQQALELSGAAKDPQVEDLHNQLMMRLLAL